MGQESAAHVWLVLSKAARAVERNAKASIGELGIGLSDFGVLELLLHKGPQPVNRIGRNIFLTSGSITAAVDRLEARQLVRRSVDPEDLRARIVQLTPTGRKLIARAFAKHAQDLEESMTVLGAREREDMVRLLKKVGMWAEARQDARKAEVRAL